MHRQSIEACRRFNAIVCAERHADPKFWMPAKLLQEAAHSDKWAAVDDLAP